MKITHDGLRMLALVFVSCNPIHGSTTERVFAGEFVNAQGLSNNQLYLIESANSGRDFEYDEYVANLPNRSSLYKYQKIKDYTEKNGKDVIDEEVVLKFFGGLEHIKKALSDNEEFEITGTDFGKRLLFIHLVVPITITAINGEFYEGIYENAGKMIVVKGIVPLLKYIPAKNSIAIKIGDVVLTHYASIISNAVSEEMKSYLLSQQMQSSEYMYACEEIGEMNFNKFWNLSKWTKQIAGVQ